MKDHKDDFMSNPKCRLINPAKSDVGLVSKKMPDNINTAIRKKSNLNQWRDTQSVINWFNDIPDKKKCKFIKFDIVEFYPSISKNLLLQAIEFAKSITTVPQSVINIILHCRKSFLFESGNIWIKKNEPDFDVATGSYDGAEICELVGLYILHLLEKEFGAGCFGLYRDDGLGYLKNLSGPDNEKCRKKLIKIFKKCDLKITSNTNLSCTDFLDITLDLDRNTFQPFRKPNNNPLYINKSSNHPSSILKQIPEMIQKRVSSLSCNEAEFNKAKPDYERALDNSGFKINLNYTPENGKRRNRRRNVTWFNPPFSSSVETNAGKIFLNLVIKHFPPAHKLCESGVLKRVW